MFWYLMLMLMSLVKTSFLGNALYCGIFEWWASQVWEWRAWGLDRAFKLFSLCLWLLDVIVCWNDCTILVGGMAVHLSRLGKMIQSFESEKVVLSDHYWLVLHVLAGIEWAGVQTYGLVHVGGDLLGCTSSLRSLPVATVVGWKHTHSHIVS